MREVSYQALVIPTKLVPAEAGSRNPVFLATSGFWIPASAGMTIECKCLSFLHLLPASAGMTVIFATSHR